MSCGGPALSRHGHRVVTHSDETLTAMKTAGEALCGVLRAAIEESPDAAQGIGSVQDRAVAALYFVLLDHPVDQHGRCRSCRRPGATFGSRRHLCRVHMKAQFWLLQPRPPRFATAGHDARIPLTVGPGCRPPSPGSAVSHSGLQSGGADSFHAAR